MLFWLTLQMSIRSRFAVIRFIFLRKWKFLRVFHCKNQTKKKKINGKCRSKHTNCGTQFMTNNVGMYIVHSKTEEKKT